MEIENLHPPNYDVAAQMDEFHRVGGELLACGTCLQSRSMEGSEVCPLSTMNDCVDMVEWADKTFTFLSRNCPCSLANRSVSAVIRPEVHIA